MTPDRPLVSIGIPTYNEARFIASTLDSLLAQDYSPIEIIITDNASTDGTSEICQQYASRESRIQYYRNPKNIGLIKNFNLCFQLAHGEFFMWAGSHDQWEPTFISICINELLNNPKSVLSFSNYQAINEKGDFLEPIPITIDTQKLDAFHRFQKVVSTEDCFCAIHGLIRSDILKKTPLFVDTIGTDLVLLTELSLFGEFIHTSRTTTYIRCFTERYIPHCDNVVRLFGEEAGNTKGKAISRLPAVMGTFELIRSVLKSSMSINEKLLLSFKMPYILRKYILKDARLEFNRWVPEKIRKTLKRFLWNNTCSPKNSKITGESCESK